MIRQNLGTALLPLRLLGAEPAAAGGVGLLVSGGEDRQVKVWSLAGGGACVATLQHGAAVKGLAVSAAGFIASAGTNGLVIWGGNRAAS